MTSLGTRSKGQCSPWRENLGLPFCVNVRATLANSEASNMTPFYRLYA